MAPGEAHAATTIPRGARQNGLSLQTFAARSWSAIGDVVGEHAAAALLEYLARTAMVDLAASLGRRPADLAAALDIVRAHLGFRLVVVLRSPHRVEIELPRDGFGAAPRPPLRVPFLRGLFQGVLMIAPHTGGWGVMVVEREDDDLVTLSRGIA